MYHIKIVHRLEKSLFDDGSKYVSLGKLKSDIVKAISNKCPELTGIISSQEHILFWEDRIKHVEKHIGDFVSEEEFEMCFRQIPDIISDPEYIAIHPNKKSVSFICRFTDYVSVAVRISLDGRLSFRTMYPINHSKLNNYLRKGRAWKI